MKFGLKIWNNSFRVFEAPVETGTGEVLLSETPAEQPPAEPETLISETAAEESPAPESGFDATPIEFTEENFKEAIKDLLPDDFEVDETGMKEFLTKMNGTTSRTEMIKQVLATYADVQKSSIEAQASAWKNMQEEWKTAAKDHPEFGGEKFTQSLTNAKTVAATYGGKDFFNFLTVTGAGNHPEMIAFLNKVYAEMPKTGAPLSGESAKEEIPLHDRLFNKGNK